MNYSNSIILIHINVFPHFPCFAGMSVFGNGKDYTVRFYDLSTNFTEYLSGLVLKRKENFTLTAAFASGKCVLCESVSFI